MTVAAQDGFVDIWDAVDQRFDSLIHFVWRRVADGVRNIDCGSTGFDGSFHDAAKEIDFSSSGIFGRKLNVIAIGDGPLHPFDGSGDDLVLRHAQFEFTMNRAGC